MIQNLPLRGWAPSALVLLAVSFGTPVATASQAKPVCDDPSTCIFTRTFNPPTPGPTTSAEAVEFEVTRADLFDVYAYGTEVRVSFSFEGDVYPFDVGRAADTGRRTWTVPEARYFTTVWTVTDPATTPYGSVYPEATHVLVTDTDPDFDGTRYQFYSFQEDRIVFSGALDAPTQGQVVIDPFNTGLSVLPLTSAVEYQVRGRFVPDDDEPDDTYPALAEGGWIGLGDLVRPDGSTVEAGGFLDDLSVFSQDNPDELIYFETYYSIYSPDGTWLYVQVSGPPEDPEANDTPREGELWIGLIEYWEVVPASSVAAERGPDAVPWSLYPNPTADVVRFSEPLTATVFDLMGRAVRHTDRAREMDLRGLAPGTYVVRSESGRSRTVTVRR